MLVESYSRTLLVLGLLVLAVLRVLSTTLPIGKEERIIFLMFMVIREQRKILIDFFLLISFYRPFLLKLWWFALVNLCFIAGDLNADPAVIPCLAKDISAGRFVDLALAYSLRAGLTPDATCRFSRDEGTGSRRDFFVGCPKALAASDACFVTDRWFTPHFFVLARFCIDAWMAYVACPVVCQPVWPACWLDAIDKSSSSATRVVQDVWDVH